MGGKTVQPAWVQGSWRYENDDGTLDGSTFIAAEDTSITQDADANFRLRIGWGESANQTTGTSLTPALQFNINGGTWTTVTTSTACKATTSTNETDGNTSTTGARIASAPTGCATFIDATFDENNTVTARAPTDDWYEVSFNLQLDSASLTDSDTINFQLIDGAATETFTTRDTPLPSLTVNIVSTVDDLLADDHQSLSQYSSPAIGQKHNLLADDHQSLSQYSSPALAEIHNLTADDSQSLSQYSSPGLTEIATDDLLADDLQSLSQYSTPAIGQEHSLTADDSESNSEYSSPAVGQVHVLLADGHQSLSQYSSPVLAEVAAGVDNLLADDLESNSEYSSPAVGQIHALLADDSESTSEYSSPVLAEVAAGTDNLLADDLESISEYSKPALSIVGVSARGGGGRGDSHRAFATSKQENGVLAEITELLGEYAEKVAETPKLEDLGTVQEPGISWLMPESEIKQVVDKITIDYDPLPVMQSFSIDANEANRRLEEYIRLQIEKQQFENRLKMLIILAVA